MAKLGGQISIDLFKSPNALADALIANPSHIVGFSNYMWNFHLSYKAVERLKMIHPEIIVVMGGPNYP
jgi:methylmalonyl-CoA mutase cobalamin-binding subunit